MAWTIKKEAVASAFARLRSMRRHEHFVGYLCMCREAARRGELLVPKPDFRGFHETFLKIEDAPLGFPYLKPFVSERATANNLWLNANVAGSYAKSSLRAGTALLEVLEISPRGYTLVHDHAKLALNHLLDGHKPLALDLALFLYRDYAWADSSVGDIINAFAYEFGFAASSRGPFSDDFTKLFDLETVPDLDEESFNREVGDIEFANEKERQSPKRSREKIRALGAEDIVPREPVIEFVRHPIERITVDGLLSFAEAQEFRLGALNILVGPNGSGKSNFIDCVRLLKTTPDSVNEVFSDASFGEWLNKAVERKTATIEAVVRLPGIESTLLHQLKFGPPRHNLASVEERLVLRGTPDHEGDEQFFSAAPQAGAEIVERGATGRRKRQRRVGDDYDHFNSVLRQVRDIDRHPEITRLARLYSSMRIYSEWTFGRGSKMRELTPSGRTDTSVAELMDNLALALNALEDRPAHQSIRNALQELKDSYEDYFTESIGARIGLNLKERLSTGSVTVPIPAKRLSDGTLRFLALAAILLTDKPAPVICLEEPELGMHPDMIRQVAKMIISASCRSQLIVSTHSELLLSALQDDFDALFSFNVSPSGTFIRRYDAEQFRGWQEQHSLGELWSLGELGGNRW